MMRTHAALCSCLTLFAALSAYAGTIDFEDISLPAGSFYNGSDLAGGFTSGNADFNNFYSTQFNAWTGWALSNVQNPTTPGLANQYASRTGGGYGGSGNYGLGFGDPNFDEISIVIPDGERFVSMKMTNSTWAFFSMLNGDSFAKKFGGATGNDPDRFGWTISGIDKDGNSTGSIEVLLADFTFANNALDYIVADWIDVDLTALGDAVRLDFEAFSTDSSFFDPFTFINTPTYIVVDNIQTVPEVSSVLLVGLAGAGLVLVRRFRRA